MSSVTTTDISDLLAQKEEINQMMSLASDKGRQVQAECDKRIDEWADKLRTDLEQWKAAETFTSLEKRKLLEELHKVLEWFASEDSKEQSVQQKKKNPTVAMVSESVIVSKDIDLVVAQAGCSRACAIKALRDNNNDIVNAIMALTD